MARASIYRVEDREIEAWSAGRNRPGDMKEYGETKKTMNWHSGDDGAYEK